MESAKQERARPSMETAPCTEREIWGYPRMKTIKLVIQDKNKVVEIPISHKELWAMTDLVYMIDCAWPTIKLNKMDKHVKTFFRKLEHAEHDCFYEGICYRWDTKTNKSYKMDEPHYLVSKPRWKRK